MATIRELRALSKDDLIERHDRLARNTQVGTGHYLQELYRRDQLDLGKDMHAYTCQIRAMTVIITVATIINVALFVYSLFV